MYWYKEGRRILAHEVYLACSAEVASKSSFLLFSSIRFSEDRGEFLDLSSTKEARFASVEV